MKVKGMIATVLTLTWMAGCGAALDQKKKDQDRDATGGTPADGSLDSDSQSELLGDDAVTDQMDEGSSLAVDVLNMDSESSSIGLGLAARSNEKDVVQEFNKKCEAKDDGTALVTVDRKFSLDRTQVAGKRQFERAISLDDHQIRTWSKDGEKIGCKDGKHHAELKDHLAAGLKLDVSFTRSRSVKIAAKTPKGDFSIERALETDGKRSIAWLSHAAEGNKVTNRVQVSSDATRSFTGKDKDGVEVKLQSHVTTAPDAPLLMDREKVDGEFSKLTIVSGRVIRQGKNKRTVTLSYENVVYTEAHRCNAESGKIAGVVQSEDGKVLATFTIDFDGDSTTVTHANGDKREFVPQGCAMESDADDKASGESAK